MMSRARAHQLYRMVLVLTVCLMAPACRTCREAGSEAGEAMEPEPSAAASHTIRKLKETVIPEMTFFAPATLSDAVDFLRQASREHDTSGDSLDKRGVIIDLHLPCSRTSSEAKGNVPVIQALSLRSVSLYAALKALCQATGLAFHIRGDDGRVMIGPDYGDEDWATRSFVVPLALSDCIFSSGAQRAPAADTRQAWKTYFGQLGVTWPEFASVDYLAAIGKLRVTNTPENLALIEWVVEQFALRMIEVEMQIHAFRTQDIERLRLAGGVSVDTLIDLRHKGKSKPVAAATALTKSGQEAVVKAVREVIYPTELEMDCSLTGSNVTARSAFGALMPGNYETRETGMILQVIPEVTQGGAWINLMLNPKWVTLEGWNTYTADLAAGWTHKALALRQPVFGVTSFETQVTVADGGTVLLGSCSTPNGEWVQVGFLTARLEEVRPETSGGGCAKTDHVRRSDRSGKNKAKEVSLVEQRMRDIVIPEITFRPPATLIDAVKFFKQASRDHDKPEIPREQRGLSFVLKLPVTAEALPAADGNMDPFAPSPPTTTVVPVIQALSARLISLRDALKLVCDVTGMKFRIRDGIIWIEPLDDPEDGMVIRFFPVLHPLSACHFEGASDKATPNDRKHNDGWKTFFVNLGVNWPDGSSIEYLRAIDMLRVTNTGHNLDVLDQVLDDLMLRPQMVEVGVQIHAFRPEDIEKLRLSGGVSVASLTELRQKGNSKTVSSATVLTKAGNEAVVRSVREVLYPSELDMDGSQRGSGITSGGGVGALMPCLFEMREVGMILQVLPEIAPDNGSLIKLLLNPQWVTLDGWESYPVDLAVGWTHKMFTMRQPVFGVTSFQTQVTVADGETVLLGGSSTPDGEWVHYGMLTARWVDVQR